MMLRVQHRRLFQIIWHPFTVFAPIPPSCPSQNVYLNSAWLELQFSVWCLIFCFSSCIPPSILKLFCILSVKMNKFLSRQNIFIPHPLIGKSSHPVFRLRIYSHPTSCPIYVGCLMLSLFVDHITFTDKLLYPTD